MSDKVTVTVLVENTAFGRHVVAQHGLSFWIESENRRLLFDTRQTPEVLEANAGHLGVDLSTADAVILSHGHYDHIGANNDLKARYDTMLAVGRFDYEMLLNPGDAWDDGGAYPEGDEAPVAVNVLPSGSVAPQGATFWRFAGGRLAL